MATMRNISMPSRSVTTSIWPISAVRRLRFRLGDEADAAHAGVRRVGHHFGDLLVARGAIGPQVDLRLGALLRRGGEARLQLLAGHALAVPVELAGAVDRDADVLGLGEIGLARRLGQL